MPVSIQPEPPKTRKWNHKAFYVKQHRASLLTVGVLRQLVGHQSAQSCLQRRAASHCIIPEARLCIAPLRREGFSRTTPDAVDHCQQRNRPLPFYLFGKQAYQRDVHLPCPRNLFLALVEEIHKFLPALFWQGLDETRAETVCSQPCRLVHRGKRFAQVLEHDLGQVLICLRTLPNFLDSHNCVLSSIPCFLPLCYPCLETRCHHVNWRTEV